MSDVFELRVEAAEPEMVLFRVEPRQFAEQDMPISWRFYFSALAAIYAQTRTPPCEPLGGSLDTPPTTLPWPDIDIFDDYHRHASADIADFVDAHAHLMATHLDIEVDESANTATVVMSGMPTLPIGLRLGVNFGEPGAWVFDEY